MIFHAQNIQKADAGVKSLAWLLVFVLFPVIIMMILACATRMPGAAMGIALCVVALIPILPVLLIIRLYRRAYRNLSYDVEDQGLAVRFFKTTLIPWSDIQGVERVNPMLILNGKVSGLEYGDLAHGLFTTRLGRAWVWLAGEREGLFLRTDKRNYVIAPENLDEFQKLIESKIRR